MLPQSLLNVACAISTLALFTLTLHAEPVYTITINATRRALDNSSKGSAFCSGVMCVRGDVIENAVQYTLTSTGAQPTGWMAIGFGQAMKDTPMVIVWPNRDGSFTLSQRKAAYETEPKVDTDPPFQASLLPQSNIMEDTHVVTISFSMPLGHLEDHNHSQIIWAFGRTHPEPEVDARLKFHYRWGSTKLLLTHHENGEVAGEEQASVPSTLNTTEKPPEEVLRPEPEALPLLPYQRTIVIHAIFTLSGFLVLHPLGHLIAHYVRIRFSPQTTIQWIVHFVAASFTIVCGLISASHAVNRAGAKHLDDAHKRWGIVIVALYSLYSLSGVLVYRTNSSNLGASRLHYMLSFLLAALALMQARNGYTTEWTAVTGLTPLPAIDLVWWTLLFGVPLVYIGGLFLRQEVLALSKSNKEEIAGESMPLRAMEEEDSTDDTFVVHGERPSKYE